MIDQDDLRYKLFLHYIENVFAYQKILNKYTGELMSPNEELMQSVEKYVAHFDENLALMEQIISKRKPEIIDEDYRLIEF